MLEVKLTSQVKEGKVTVPANLITNLSSLIFPEKITLKEENQNLLLLTENKNILIQGQSVEEYPIIPKVEKEIPYKLPVGKLIEGLQQVIDIPSPSQIRPEISGVYFSIKKQKLKIVATDSFRLGEKTIDLKEEVKKESNFILTQEAARELLNILSYKKEGEIICYPNPNQVLFELLMEETSHPQINLMSRLIEGEYPKYQEIIPKKSTVKIQIEKEGLANQIKEAGLFSGKILEVKLTSQVKEGKLKIFSQSSDIGRSETYLPAQIEGEELEISFNYKFLLDGLNNIKSSEVILELSGEEGPALLRPVGDESYIYILMPIKSS
ncbi:MAG: DNA polymerase III subunit beta [Candidatus Nealsonbacteria bacterium]|nr:MAG: DNA polymerase III subunit beta [Candidatus Nealsonbacteria bacterium]